MEFSTLTRRVAEFAGMDRGSMEPDGKLMPRGAPKQAKAAEQASLPFGSAKAGAVGKPREAPARKADDSQAELTPQARAAARIAAARNAKLERSRYEIVRDLEPLVAWISRAREFGTVAIDIDPTSIDPMQASLCGFSLALTANEACYVPLAHRKRGDGGDGSLFAGEIAPAQIEERAALAALKPLLEDPQVLKIGRDLMFAVQMFALRGIELAPHDDIMLMSYVLDAGRSDHTLASLSQRYLGHTPIDQNQLTGSGKSRLAFDCGEMEKAGEYAAESADMTLRLWQVLKARVAAERVSSVYETLERPLIAVLARMERRGISIDRQVLSRLSGEFAQRAGALEAEIQVLAGEPLNPGSPKQLGDILFGKLGLPGGTKTKTGQWSTGARALEDLAEQGHALPRKILDWLHDSKLKSTYSCALPRSVNPMTASEVFGVPVKGMPGEIRRRAKAINFGIIYGISAFGLANQLGIEREEAGAYIKKYFERFPGIRDYMEETKAFAKQNGYVLTLFGRKCHYPDIANPNPTIRAFNERAAINARLQGTAADIIRRAMVRMEPALATAKLSAQMLLQVHDELVFEVLDAEVEKTLPVIEKVMAQAPMPALSLSVPLAVEARAAHNWDEAH